jgi:hypothetical protein
MESGLFARESSASELRSLGISDIERLRTRRGFVEAGGSSFNFSNCEFDAGLVDVSSGFSTGAEGIECISDSDPSTRSTECVTVTSVNRCGLAREPIRRLIDSQ